MTTKIDHLKVKIARLERDAAEIAVMLERARMDMRGATDTAPYPSGPQTCSGCGTRLHSEYEFWNHFHVPDATYLNLGDCPKTKR